MLKLVVLGALGYLGYRYLGIQRAADTLNRASAVAGGPLSKNATLQKNADQPA